MKGNGGGRCAVADEMSHNAAAAAVDFDVDGRIVGAVVHWVDNDDADSADIDAVDYIDGLVDVAVAFVSVSLCSDATQTTASSSLCRASSTVSVERGRFLVDVDGGRRWSGSWGTTKS